MKLPLLILSLLFFAACESTHNDTSIKPSERKEFGVLIKKIDFNCKVNKACLDIQDKTLYETCREGIKNVVNEKYTLLDRAWKRKQNEK